MFIDYKISQLTKKDDGSWLGKVKFYEGGYRDIEDLNKKLVNQYARSKMSEERIISFDSSFTEDSIRAALKNELKKKEKVGVEAIIEQKI